MKETGNLENHVEATDGPGRSDGESFRGGNYGTHFATMRLSGIKGETCCTSESLRAALALRPQVYELTLRYAQHPDHNVVTGALELLQQLLRTPPPALLRALTTPGGLAQLGAPSQEPGGRSRSGSIVELIGEFLA